MAKKPLGHANRRKSPSAGKPANPRLTAAQVRRKARLATASYQRLLKRYLSRQNDPDRARAAEHARLVNAYRITLAWRQKAGLN